MIMDDRGVPTIVELGEDEIKSWRKQYGKIRNREMLKPAAYIDKAVMALGGRDALVARAHEPTKLIGEIRDAAWKLSIEHEQLVCGQALVELLGSKVETRAILTAIVTRDGTGSFKSDDPDFLADVLSKMVGEVSGRAFPYIYELAKSVTQSRRSRAGTAFERLIHHIMDAKGYPYDSQSKTGTELFESAGLGKKVDGIVPSIEAYRKKRTQCAIITMKTSLRERWQEVVEEIERTKVPHIFLLTLDDGLNASNLQTMKNHNITLVVPLHVQKANHDKSNVISFETLFNEELPHILKNWQ